MKNCVDDYVSFKGVQMRVGDRFMGRFSTLLLGAGPLFHRKRYTVVETFTTHIIVAKTTDFEWLVTSIYTITRVSKNGQSVRYIITDVLMNVLLIIFLPRIRKN